MVKKWEEFKEGFKKTGNAVEHPATTGDDAFPAQQSQQVKYKKDGLTAAQKIGKSMRHLFGGVKKLTTKAPEGKSRLGRAWKSFKKGLRGR